MRRHKPIGARQQDVWALFGTRHCEWQVDEYGRYFHNIMSLWDFTMDNGFEYILTKSAGGNFMTLNDVYIG